MSNEGENGFSCSICDNADNDQMVQCDHCDHWFHFSCVGVTSDVNNVSWSCTRCKGEKLPTKTSSQGAPPSNVQPMDNASKGHKPAATSSPKWSSGESTETVVTKNVDYQNKNLGMQKEIRLQLLEEERKLQQLYLQKKYEIIAESETQPGTISNLANTNADRAYGPTQAQLAARQVMPKDLPSFNGDPEEWPIFISCFENSTAAAGYSHVENLIRLQASLKGKARDIVRNKLLIPSMVPDIIKTLKMFFGRPEHIIESMIERVRRMPAPKEKLEAIIEYALCVSNICATMESCKMHAHLNNPMLVKELVDKLPNNYKLQWAMYTKDGSIPALKSFNNWLYQIAEAASQVVSPLGAKKNVVINTHIQADVVHDSKCIVCKKENHKLSKCKTFDDLTYNEKWQVINKYKLCRQCLNSHRRKCFLIKQCGVEGCTAKHHSMLHKPQEHVSPKRQVSGNENLKADRNEEAVNVNTHCDADDSQRPFFRIIPIRIHSKNITLNTFAFLDEGSSVTLIEKDTFYSLGLVGIEEPLCLKWTGDTMKTENASQRASINVSNPITGVMFTLNDVHTIDNLALPQQSLNMQKIAERFPYLAGVPISSYEDARPTVLIGADNWRLAVPLKVKEGKSQQPIATKTRLGWALQGNVPGHHKSYRLNVHICECEHRYKELHDEVKQFFAIESPRPSALFSKDDERALQILNSTSKLSNGRFETGLLWRNDEKAMPESYQMAHRRLMCLEKKFHREPGLKEKMNREIKNLISKNYARKLTPSEISADFKRVWYLPIFVTASVNKPDRLRLVWDAAAKSHGVSLNDLMLSGPDLLIPLVDVLLAFRVGAIAICADISEMFHQIKVRDDDMHAQRFLWWSDGDSLTQPSTYVMSALTFGMSCAPCIAHYIRNKNADRFQQQNPRAVEAIKKHHYVDDFIDSADNQDEAVDLASEVKRIHAAAGFKLHKWTSNSTAVLEQLLVEETAAQATVQLGSHEKILGMYWEPTNDVFKYILRFAKLKRDLIRKEVVPTKRETLQVLMSIFDPLGFIACLTIRLKILLQMIWRSGIGWDDELPEHLSVVWQQWKTTIPYIEAVQIPRCYAPKLKDAEDVQLHTLVDAGEYAYAAVCYLRVKLGDKVLVALVAAKSKVAPLKPVSIPRLELQAAVMGLKLANKICSIKRIPIKSVFWWSDSKTVLKWLQMDPRKFQPYVMHRVGEILENSSPKQWKWVPSKLNTADLATKSSSTLSTDIWFTGPDFLQCEPSEWPCCNDLGAVDEAEIRHSVLLIRKSWSGTLNINYHYFSDWKRLYRAFAYFLVYIEKLKPNYVAEEENWHIQIEKAKRILLQQAQLSEYGDEISCLSQDANGLLRVRSRAEYLCNYDDATVLPRGHYVTFLIVRSFHEANHHMSHETTINSIRGKFCISKLRVLYKTVRNTCQKCKNYFAKPNPPQMAPLPVARLAVFERPFTFVGIDFFGPFLVAVGRRREKRWGVVFTCLTLRAIHIEVAHSLDTSSCVMCLRNFFSRRGTPREIYTDNGTNFKATEKVLSMEYNNINFPEIAAKYDDLKWKFNPPAAPHMGGAWERLVRSIKTALSSCCPQTNFNDENLRSALLEVEFMINARPLTFVSLDTNDDEAITPNHLLLGSSGGYKPLCEDGSDLRQRWRQTQTFAEHFWRRWIKEYTPVIARRSKWFDKQPPVKEGDVVVIVDENLPRNCWPKGIVIQTVVAKDGQVRRATIKTQYGNLVRPTAKIAVLDVVKSN